MKKNKKIAVLLLFVLGITIAQAQQAFTTAGGNASGSGGTVSYSVGQVVYSTNPGVTGSVAQGVQQPYEISTVSGVEAPQITLKMLVTLILQPIFFSWKWKLKIYKI